MNRRVATSALLACVLGTAVLSAAVPEEEQSFLTVAEGAYRDGLYDVAKGQLEQLLKKFPQSFQAVRARLLLGHIGLQTGDYAASQRQFSQALAAKPSPLEEESSRLGLGEALYRLKRYQQAIETLSPLAGMTPPAAASGRGYYWIGESYAALGKLDLARSAYSQALKGQLSPDIAEFAHLSLGWTGLQQGDANFAWTHLKPLLGTAKTPEIREQAQALGAQALYNLQRYSQAQEAAGSYLQKYPQGSQRIPALRTLAFSLLAQEKSGPAAEALARFAKALPAGSERADALYRRVLCRVRDGHPDLITTACRESLQEKPSLYPAEVGLYLGQALQKLGKTEEAVKAFATASKADGRPEWKCRSQAAKGLLEVQLQRYGPAVKTLEPLDRECSLVAGPETFLALGLAAQSTGDLNLAFRAFEQVAGDSPLAVQARFEGCRTLFQRKHFVEAAARLAPLLESAALGDYLAPARFFLAESLYQAGKLSEARAAYEAYLRLNHLADEDRRFARYRLASAAAQSGDQALALQEYQALGNEAGAGQSDALRQAALILERQGDIEAAAKTWMTFLSRFPQDPKVSSAFDHLLDLVANPDAPPEIWEDVAKALGSGQAQGLSPSSLLALATVAVGKGLCGPVKALLEPLAALAPGDAGGGQARLLKARCLEAEGDLNASLEVLKALAGGAPGGGSGQKALLLLGRWATHEERWEEAAAFLNRVTDAAYLDEALFNLGHIYARLNRDTDATRAWEALVKSGKQEGAYYAEAIIRLAVAEEKAGHWPQARDLYERYTQIGTDPQWLTLAVKRAEMIRSHKLGKDGNSEVRP